MGRSFSAATERFLQLHAELAERVIEVRDGVAEWNAFELNRHALTAGRALLELLERHKRERRPMDFADLEWHADRLLSDESEGALLAARLGEMVGQWEVMDGGHPRAVRYDDVLILPAANPTFRVRACIAQRWHSLCRRLHALLEARAFATDALPARPANSTDEVIAATERQAQAIPASPALQDFFDPGRYLRAFNEIEILLADGSTGRMDRLVGRPNGWWITDYKSGSPGAAPLDEYRIRVDQYREDAAQMFPKYPVRGVLVFPDVHRIDL